MSKIKLSYQEIIADTTRLFQIIQNRGKRYTNIYAIPRGGVPVAMLLAVAMELPLANSPDEIVDSTLIVDDLVDSGVTLSQYENRNDTAVLYVKSHSPRPTYHVQELEGWVEFPYEETETDEQSVIVRLLEILGEDPTREGLLDTPKRVIKFYKQFLEVPAFNFTAFEAEGYDEMIVQKDIPFFSMCEHHMAPFFGHATVAYIPDAKIVGLSKLARTVELYSHRLQNQERITSQIAERLSTELAPKGVAVSLTARHFCMEMRGVKTHDVHTTTTKLTGVFMDTPEARHEFMSILKG